MNSPPMVPQRTYLNHQPQPQAPEAPERKSSIPPQAQVVQRSQYSSVQEVINNPKAYTSDAVQQVVRQILITVDATNDERVFATKQILGHQNQYTDMEAIAVCRFSIQHWQLFKSHELRYVVGKVAAFQDYYENQVALGLMREDAPHFNDKDLVLAAEIFIYINAAFFSSTTSDVSQFLAFAGNKASMVNEYRDAQFDLLCKLGLDEKAEELWKAKKYVKAPSLNMEITTFLLKHMNHPIFGLWADFQTSRASSLQSVTTNLY